MELGFRILFVSGIPDSLSCIADSKAHDSGFHSHHFQDSEIRISLLAEGKMLGNHLYLLWGDFTKKGRMGNGNPTDGRFPFVITDRLNNSCRNLNFLFNLRSPARSVKLDIVCTKEKVFSKKRMEEVFFIVRITGLVMVSPAGPFWLLESALRLLPGTGGLLPCISFTGMCRWTGYINCLHGWYDFQDKSFCLYSNIQKPITWFCSIANSNKWL